MKFFSVFAAINVLKGQFSDVGEVLAGLNNSQEWKSEEMKNFKQKNAMLYISQEKIGLDVNNLQNQDRLFQQNIEGLSLKSENIFWTIIQVFELIEWKLL